MNRFDLKTAWLGCLLAVFLFGSVEMMAQPAHDNCVDANVTVLTSDGFDVSISGDGTDATLGPDFPAAQVWEAFTISVCSEVVISFCDSENPPTNIFGSCYTDCADISGSGIEPDVTDCDGDGVNSTVTWSVLEPGTYYYPVIADLGFMDALQYTITVSATLVFCVEPPVNDFMCDPTNITVGGGAVTATNVGAMPDGTQASCWSDAEVEGDIWFTFTAPGSGVVEVETIDTGDNDDTQLAIYSSSDGTCTGTLTEVGCNDDISGTDFMSYTEAGSLTPGDLYWIQIDGWQGANGSFDITVDEVGGIEECPNPGAIICDNADGYILGPMNGQGAHWSTWSGTLGGAEDAIVTDEQAFSNSQSVLVAEGQTQDPLLLLGNQTTGQWDVSWMEYIPANATGYYNIQEDEVPGVAWNLDVFFNQDGGAPGVGTITTTTTSFDYPEDAWFAVEMSLDLDADLLSVTIDGVAVLTDEPYTGNLGAINFFSIDATNRFYLDDVIYDDVTGVEECPAPDAIICDNADEYILGPMNGQGAHWSTWGGAVGGADDGIVTDEQAFSNSQSVLIAEGQAQDVLLLLGNQTSGQWDISWMEYVPANATAYYNIQEDEVPGVAWNLDVFFNQDGGAPGAGIITTSGNTFTYPEDAWFTVEMSIDLDADLISVTIDGVAVDVDEAFAGSIGAINFFSIDATNRYYLDDVVYDGDNGIEECPAPDAIICDNADGYILGPMNGQGAHWSTWSGTLGGAEDAIVTDEQAFSNSQSVLVAEGQTQDPLLLLGNQTIGTWDISWMEYIPANATGYYNIQEDETPGVAWNLDVFFNQGGTTPGTGTITTTGSTFTYPEDTWFAVEMSLDLDADLISVTIDGVAVEVDTEFLGNLGAINFFSIDATNRFYLDDVVFDGDSGIDECPAPTAIICDNADGYILGPMNGQGAHWSTWSGTLGGAEDAIVTDEQAFSNSQSVLVAEGQTQDPLLLLGNQTSGQWDISWMEYIPANATGYYNIQEDETPGVAWNLDVFFNQGGTTPGMGTITTTGSTFTYPEDAWFAVEMSLDLDADLISVTIDGVAVEVDTEFLGNLGAINFFSIDATNRFYLDDVVFDGDSGVTPGADCASAIDVSAGGIFSSPELSGALEGFAGSCWTGTNLTANDWYSYTATSDGVLTVTSVDIGGTDTELAIATGDCGDLTEIGCSEDFTGEAPWESEVSVPVTSGETYYIIWGNGWNGDAFDFEVSIGDGVDPCPAPAAIICDNADGYILGPMNGQGAHWSTWSGTLGGAEDAIVTDEQAFSNSQSVLVAEGQTQDVLLLLGNQTTGQWDISWMEYVPANATAYYNIQEDETPGVAWNLDVFFNQGGTTPGTGTITTTGSTFTYPEDTWFAVEMSLDLDADLISVTIDGVAVEVDTEFLGNLGSINFFSIDATNRFYLDDVVFDGMPNPDGLLEFTESAFTIYPNPTEDMLTISGEDQIDAIVVRDVLGAIVRQLDTPFSNNVTLDITDLTDGVYFVEVRVGDVVNVSRVVKQ